MGQHKEDIQASVLTGIVNLQEQLSDLQEDPVFILGIVGGTILLLVHFLACGYVLFCSVDASEEEESLLSDASIARHRRLFELQAQWEGQQHPNEDTVVLDTLNRIKWENRHQPLSLSGRIKELHARLIENGTLPKLPRADHID